ncbi:GNAT family N-acetyltransferase [Bacillus cereus]|uniref:Acetyltransferase n=1 Tax=Bacillus paramycoides TaxID=2026194 RepID=A0A1J9VIK1_9BACI|nr:GNAT family N-acetyltransferase [Bacillus paramycoides]PFM60780.1 GNAT family N-acetyltransferase [Bacillus cereus]MED0964089.1 GNAT family N-acetyltransferase [Bacillus paramycoides]MED0973218.1 GNAT family N-acetyltransferase [Bacillus paramycoides]MED0982317.1 GNAT family N-acetyltransferase [Bacillus paramycoides]MED0987461.1 GNAT family N-acetyltransferase [Bacillus paramycoides]
MGNVDNFANLLLEEPKREQLFPLFEEVFGITSQTWHDFSAKGYWDYTYKALSFLQDDSVIANAAAFSLPLLINGEKISAAGIQSVMTHPDFRRQGLMTQLLNKLIEEIDKQCECILLFTENPKLYTSFGFQIVQEYLMTVPYDKKNNKDSLLRKLDFYNEEDRQLISETIANSQRLSNMFSTLNYQPSFYLNMYDSKWNEKLYYSKKLDTMIVYEVENEKLKLFGVFALVLPILDELCEEISESFKEIEFYFYPDQLGIDDVQLTELQSSKYLMVRSNKELDFKGYKFPVLTEF